MIEGISGLVIFLHIVVFFLCCVTTVSVFITFTKTCTKVHVCVLHARVYLLVSCFGRLCPLCPPRCFNRHVPIFNSLVSRCNSTNIMTAWERSVDRFGHFTGLRNNMFENTGKQGVENPPHLAWSRGGSSTSTKPI